jgi:Gpi18-like mannosyltransferase
VNSLKNDVTRLGYIVSATTMMASALLIGHASGSLHDYKLYIAQWNLVLSHQDPWSTDNAYGPLYNLLAYIMKYFGVLAPKYFSIIVWSSFFLFCWYLTLRSRNRFPKIIFLFLFGIANFLVFCMVFLYGSNDSLVSASVGFALLFYLRGKTILPGILFGLAALIKFYPLLLIPFFILDSRKNSFKAGFIASSIFVLGMVGSFFYWGKSTLHPVMFGIDRGPNLLSILNTIQAHSKGSGNTAILSFLIHTNVILVVSVLALCLYLSYKNEFSTIQGVAISLPIILLSYKEGNVQYYLTWLAVVSILVVDQNFVSQKIIYHSLPFAFFLSIFQFGYELSDTGHYNKGWGTLVRDNCGITATIFGIAMFLPLLLRKPTTKIS